MACSCAWVTPSSWLQEWRTRRSSEREPADSHWRQIERHRRLAPVADLCVRPLCAMKTCRACGTKNEREAGRCSKSGIEFPRKKESPLQSARNHLRNIGFTFLACGLGTCLFFYIGLARGTLFQSSDGSMRYPHAGRNFPILTIAIALGLSTCFLIPEFVRSRRAYQKELKRTESNEN